MRKLLSCFSLKKITPYLLRKRKIKNLKLWLFKFCLQLSAFLSLLDFISFRFPLSWLSGGVGGLKQPLVDA